VQYLVTQYPEALRVRDNNGCLPIHVAVAHGAAATGAVPFLVEQYPQATATANDRGKLPLHLAVARRPPPVEAALFLVEKAPLAPRARGAGGGECSRCTWRWEAGRVPPPP
jgi:ankyrin repeat protein